MEEDRRREEGYLEPGDLLVHLQVHAVCVSMEAASEGEVVYIHFVDYSVK